MYFDFVSKTHLWQKEPALCQKQFHGQLHIIFCWKSRLASNKWNIIFWCPWFPGKLFSVTHGLKSTKQVMSINKFQKAFSFYSSKSTKLSPSHQLRLSECFLETLQLLTKNIVFIINQFIFNLLRPSLRYFIFIEISSNESEGGGQFDSIAWNRYYPTSNGYDKVSVSSGSSGPHVTKNLMGQRMHNCA